MSEPVITMDKASRRPNYDKFPAVAVPGATAGDVVSGWEAIASVLRVTLGGRTKVVVAVETYPDVHDAELLPALKHALRPSLVVEAKEAYRSADAVASMVDRDLTEDPVFGRLTVLQLADFLDADRRAAVTKRIASADGITLIYGTGATLLAAKPDFLIYADMARWEIQMRQRRKEVGNLFIDNAATATPAQKYKRAYFLDWRLADQQKRQVFGRVDWFLDTNVAGQPKLARGDVVRHGLAHATTRPFRVVPFFDPGPWGGQWMRTVCELDKSQPNFAWCFDCVPEENSLLLDIAGTRIELPSIDLVFEQPKALLGEAVYGRFGNEFPIRFDFLDTIGGGNLSLQVHPLTDYIQRTFGMHYTQDESYYMLDADGDATVYLGFKENIDRPAFLAALSDAQADAKKPLDAGQFINEWPAKRHDHFLIPAGTIHCSGQGGMVLEISATPYIFTFKLWDWGRLGMDGKPRPIHLAHGTRNLQFDRTTDWVKKNLVNHVEPLERGDGWSSERTGLHEAEFIETIRHWFTKSVTHDTRGGVHVLNLIQGEEALVESPTNAFEPYVVHYAETFIVPAAVGAYMIRPHGIAVGTECATLQAFVRSQA